VKAEIHFDVDRLQKAFNLTERQLSFAAERALNDTAFKAREDWGKYIQQKVDRPVPMTVKSALVKKARRANLVATVFLRNEASKGTRSSNPDIRLAPAVSRFLPKRLIIWTYLG
jgi:predicted metal-dependent peptidase